LSEKLKILKKALGNPWNNGHEHLFHCPKCNHHKRKMSINIEKDVFKCWICDYSGTKISQLLRKFASNLYAEWKQISGEIDLAKYDFIFSESQEVELQAVDLPDGFKTLTGEKTPLKEKPLRYLYSRGLTDFDILFWKIGFCDFGEYRGRIIIPSFNLEGSVNYFIARTYIDDWTKYKNPPASKDIVFNDLNIDWSNDILLVEGVFDAIRCKNAVPLLGSTLKENSKLFEKICDKKPNIYMALDLDAQEKQLLIANKIKEYGISVKIINTSPYNDIAEMPLGMIEDRKKTATIVSEMDYLHYKLSF